MNTERTPRRNYLVLHRASCHTITKLVGNAARWTANYAKFCGDLQELEGFARQQVGADPRRCIFCL